MKFGLSKYLGYIVAIPLISSCCFASDKQKCPDELTREMYKHSWHAHLSKTWKCADIKAKTWWKAEMYEDSIFDVIPQAIADCLTGNKEFATPKKGFSNTRWNGIIVFDTATPDKMEYKAENWNAFVLWNFICKALQDENKDKKYSEILDEACVCIDSYCIDILNTNKDNESEFNKDYHECIQDARNDIEQYIKETGVNLVGYINEIKKIPLEARMEKAPHTEILRRPDSKNSAIMVSEYPNYSISMSVPQWENYVINYTNYTIKGNKIEPAEGPAIKRIPVVTYVIPEGILEYSEQIENTHLIQGAKIFNIPNNDMWKKKLKAELPQKYTLSFKTLPKGITKEIAEDKAIEMQAEAWTCLTWQNKDNNTQAPLLKDEKGNNINPGTLSPTEYANKMANETVKREWCLSKIGDVAKYKAWIDNFRDTFNLSEEEYSDEKTYDILRAYDFNFEEAFSSLFS